MVCFALEVCYNSNEDFVLNDEEIFYGKILY